MSVAASYAKALYESAQEGQAQNLDLLESQMDQMVSILSQTPNQANDTRIALVGPLTSSREKGSLIEALSKKCDFSPLFTNFLNLLVRKGRLSLLKEMRDAFTVVRLASEGGISGRLVAAEQISQADVDLLAKAFSKKLGKTVSFRVSSDPSLLAGVKVTVNGITYDGTLRSQLQKLRDRVASGLPQAHV